MNIGDHQILLHGVVTTITREEATFIRVRSLQGSRSADKAQERKRFIGNHVYVAGSWGRMDATIVAVSSDRHAWRDEHGDEYLTSQILLP